MCAERTEKNLSSNSLSVLTTLKKAAFTLAEVLITLGIIGVVAALTLPTLIEHHKEKVILTKLSQTQSLLAQTFKLAEANDEDIFLLMSNNENGSGIPDSENLTNIANSANLANIFRKYTKLALDCGSVDEEHACTPTQQYKYLNGRTYMANFATNPAYYKFILYNGVSVFMNYDINNGKIWLRVDVNGKGAPNVIGKDLFEYYYADGKISPTPNWESNCKIGGAGWACSEYIQIYHNLNYLKNIK